VFVNLEIKTAKIDSTIFGEHLSAEYPVRMLAWIFGLTIQILAVVDAAQERFTDKHPVTEVRNWANRVAQRQHRCESKKPPAFKATLRVIAKWLFY
jgi:hypothetical protein